MLRLRSVGMSVLALGMTAMVPGLASADRVRDAHDVRRPVPVEHRVEREEPVRRVASEYERHDRDIRVERNRDWDYRVPVRITPDCDISVRLADVPYGVLDTANREHRGPIESARFIRHDGVEFYSLIVDGRGGDVALRIDLSGCLLGVDRC